MTSRSHPDSRGPPSPARRQARRASMPACRCSAPKAMRWACSASPTSCRARSRPQQLEGLQLLARQTQHLLELRRFMLRTAPPAVDPRSRARGCRTGARRPAAPPRRPAVHRHPRPLTGLFNRVAMARLRRARRCSAIRPNVRRTCLLLLDIDHFKQINDRHGHLLGDARCARSPTAVIATVRKDDIAVRYGGEEFLVSAAHATWTAARKSPSASASRSRRRRCRSR